MTVWMSHREFYARDAARTQERRQRESWLSSWRDYDKRLFPDRINCPGTLTFQLDVADAHLLEAICDVCGFMVAVPRRTVDPTWQAEQLRERAELPVLADKPFDDRAESAAAYLAMTDFLRRPKVVKPPLLHGKAGVGKTHLLAWAGKQLCTDGIRVLYRDIRTLLSAERDYIDHPRGMRPFDAAVEAKVLILDDLGAERSTPWTTEQIDDLVDRRYRANRPILAATNLDLDQWAEAFGDRTASRLGGMTQPIFMGGADMRLVTALDQGETA
jgi:DNA replication protein DnaC